MMIKTFTVITVLSFTIAAWYIETETTGFKDAVQRAPLIHIKKRFYWNSVLSSHRYRVLSAGITWFMHFSCVWIEDRRPEAQEEEGRILMMERTRLVGEIDTPQGHSLHSSRIN